MPGQRDETPISTLEAWGLAPGKRVWVGGGNASAHREVESLLLADIERPPTGPIDLAILTPQSTDEAVYFARKLRPRLRPHAPLWIVFPKRGNPHEQEFTGNLDEMIIAFFELGFSEAMRAAVGEDYSSTAFRMGDDLM
jgi:hypothetical protein